MNNAGVNDVPWGNAPWEKIRLPCRLGLAFPDLRLFLAKPPLILPMKIRTLLFALACSLAVSPVVRAADAETELGGKMEKMSSAFRVIRRQIADASKNADSLAKLAVVKENAEASLKFEPALKSEKPKGDQAKFVEEYQAGMKKFVELCGKLEAALKKGDNTEAAKICGAMGDAQKAGHKEFKKDDKKKK